MKRKSKPTKRFFAILLALTMVIGLLPTLTLAGSASEVSILVKYHDSGEHKAELSATKRGSMWMVDYSGIEADEMRTAFDFVAIVDGAEFGAPLTWSVEGYAREARLNEDSTDAELEFFNALLHYVDAVARADFSEKRP